MQQQASGVALRREVWLARSSIMKMGAERRLATAAPQRPQLYNELLIKATQLYRIQ
jgi:hypothetical protein